MSLRAGLASALREEKILGIVVRVMVMARRFGRLRVIQK